MTIHSAGDKGFWPASVCAVYSDRLDGFSKPPFDGFNLGDHVGDEPQAVDSNRARLVQQLAGCEQVQWLQQVHGTELLLADRDTVSAQPEADAAITSEPGIAAAVMTADCLPVLISDSNGDQVAAVHAGWRGLLAGVIGTAIDAFDAPSQELRVWLGPCIGPRQFEVGSEVRDAFLLGPEFGSAIDLCFAPSGGGRYLADLHGLARWYLAQRGVVHVAVNSECTAECSERYFSYRRDGQSGRMVSLIYRRDI